MDEYIRKEDAIKCIEDQCIDGKIWGSDEDEGTLIEAYSAINDLMDIPIADVAPVRHGRWIGKNSPYDVNIHVCSVCKKQVSILGNKLRYCPNCGAKMDGERREENK